MVNDAPPSPVVTVVIPTMNQAELLQRALRGLARQTERGFSVVLINDGSTDDTERRISGLALPFAVTLVSTPNGGPARARNLGIRMADDSQSGAAPPAAHWIAFLDDDVVPAVGWMAAIKAAALDSSAEVLVGKTTTTTMATPTAFSHQLTVLAKPPGPFPTCNLAVRRDVFDRCGGFDRRFPHPAFEDTDWSLHARQAGVDPVFVEDMAVDHPPRPSSLKGHLARVRYQAGAVRLAQKHRLPSAMVGITDVMEYVGLVGTLVWLDQPWMWPFLAAWALGVYVRAASFLMLRAYRPREALSALVIPIVTPWYKLVIYARALFTPWVWAPPDTRLGPLPEGARVSFLSPRAPWGNAALPRAPAPEEMSLAPARR